MKMALIFAFLKKENYLCLNDEKRKLSKFKQKELLKQQDSLILSDRLGCSFVLNRRLVKLFVPETVQKAVAFEKFFVKSELVHASIYLLMINKYL